MVDLGSILAHCRMGVVYRMSPAFFFALTLLQDHLLGEEIGKVVTIFCILHFLLYPSCHLFNDYCDKDEGPIACMEKPVPIKDDTLYWASLLMDSVAGVWSLVSLGPGFFLYSILFSLGSRAYSHPSIRIKARPFGALFGWNFLEGYLGIMAIYLACQTGNRATFWDSQAQFGALNFTLSICGAWPIFQIYQHDQDGKNGELTLSRWLGVRGTMLYVFITMFLSLLGHFLYFWAFLEQPAQVGGVFLGIITPPLIYFLNWWVAVWRDDKNADYGRTMRFTFLSATAGIFFYCWLILR